MRRTITVMAVVMAIAAAPARVAAEGFDLGGAIRFNYGWRDYTPANRADFDLELLRVDLDCEVGRFLCSVQHRWYDGFDAIHHAWAGWRTGDDHHVRIGVSQVPFGLLPYASHSFWFGSGYYLGLEDDHDLGVGWTRENEDWRFDLAAYAGDEYGTGRDFGRYSFDVATTADLPLRERERLAGRVERRFEAGGWALRAGASLMAGSVERRPDGRDFDHLAGAVHLEARRGALELEAQWARYDYGVPGNRIALSGFLFPFEIAAAADVLSANLAWTFDEVPWFDAITCYNDFSTTRASGPGLDDSIQNVTGCSFARGVMFTYVDWIAGRNMWFAGGPGIGISEPGGDRWRSRLNVNVGFYF